MGGSIYGGGIYHYNGNNWVGYPGAGTDIGVGSDGAVWIVNSLNNIYALNNDGKTWT